ncbi:Hypothetical protein A7982_06861 [Minicystis rosea]|nr:Hypothetical protein A7982_06861 [Minicystis rosea]
MKSLLSTSLLTALTLLLLGCDNEPAANKFCKGPDGNVQDCAIACMTTKATDVCKLYETKTKAVCDKVGKAACQRICDKDKNEHACAHVKTMK